MAVYVDPPLDYGAVATAKGLPHTRWSHMTADDREELHAFAAQLGLRRSWFQNHGYAWHYDITPAKREQALRMGAKSISSRDLGLLLAARRETLGVAL